ncbi:SRPBCC family protein [Plantibacter sp. YIM 135249]|jgi:uncharacterized protein YndB with AHSA1/START domain|uniref:SRPBCC family protein n=1 Tax=Plantibacter sp. YIM 135249 TaxID=3423918 RepID=UPI003D32A66B
MTDGLSITRTFAAPPELVYAAWTTPDQFSVWFGTDAVDVPLDTVSMDVRVGGEWRADMHLPDGHVIHWLGEYTAVDEPGFLAFTMTDDPARPSREPVTVAITAVADGAEMTLTQNGGNLTPEQYEQTVIGYNGFFDVLERVLAEQQA